MPQMMKPFQAARTLDEKELLDLLIEYHNHSVASDTPEGVSDWLHEKLGARVQEAHLVLFSKATTTDGSIRWLKKFMAGKVILGLYSVLHRKEQVNVAPVQTTTFEFVKEESEDDFGKSETPETGSEEA